MGVHAQLSSGEPVTARAAHVAVRGLTRIFPGANGRPPLQALGPLDLDLAQGEFFSVVGPSGCGKSTLLDILAGLSAASAGSVTFEGKPVAGTVPDGVGVVFQEDSSFPGSAYSTTPPSACAG